MALKLKPIKVTAHMHTGRVVTTDLCLPLDSVLGWAWMMENHREKMSIGYSGIDIDKLIDPELPLLRRESEGIWYWAASYAFGEPKREQVSYWHKRFDAAAAEQYLDFGKRRGTVNTGSGWYKSYRMPLVEFLLPKLEWWLVGDLDEVRRLLARITHLGKKRSQGKGRVAKWTVQPAEEDNSNARPIPDSNGTEMHAIRPPYWLQAHVCRVRWPEDPGLACNYLRNHGGALTGGAL